MAAAIRVPHGRLLGIPLFILYRSHGCSECGSHGPVRGLESLDGPLGFLDFYLKQKFMELANPLIPLNKRKRDRIPKNPVPLHHASFRSTSIKNAFMYSLRIALTVRLRSLTSSSYC